MANISTWSTTAADNDASPPDGWPENQAPSTVNDCGREMMAAMRTWYVDSEWVNWGHTPTRVDNDTFTVSTDLTATYHAGRRLKVDGSATGYCTIASSSYGAPNTTVNVTMDSGNLPATLSTVYIAAVSATNSSLPPAFSGTTGMFSGAVTATGFIPTGSTVPANGMYLSAANTVAFATNSAARVILDSATLGVGAAASVGNAAKSGTDRMVEVSSTTNGDIVGFQAFVNEGSNGRRAMLWVDDTAGTFGLTGTASSAVPDFKLEIGGLTPLSVNSSGNVTIAAPSSGDALTVNAAASSYGLVIAQQPTTPGLRISNGSGSMYLQASGGNSVVGTDGAWGLDLYTNSTQRVTVGSAGNVTINAPSSGATLTAAAGSSWAAWTSSSAGSSYMSFANSATRGYIGTDGGAIVGTGTGTNFGIRAENDLYLMAGAANRVTVASTGNVTIGAASSGDELTVTGSVVATSFSGDGSALTSMSATQLTSGTVPDARFPATLPAASGANLTALNASNLSSGTVPSSRITSVDATATISSNLIGFRDIPRQTSGWNRGQCTALSAGATLNTSDMAAGYTFSVYNDSGSNITITQGAGVTLRLHGTSITGNRTLLARGFATFWCNSGTEAIAMGDVT